MPFNQATAERVQRGALLLDALFPGWIERVNLDRPVTNYDDLHVIEQAAGSYDRLLALTAPYMRDYDSGWEGRYEHGFVPHWDTDKAEDTVYCQALREAWASLVTYRRAHPQKEV